MAAAIVDTPVGPLGIEASSGGVRRIVFLNSGRGGLSREAFGDDRDGEAMVDRARRQIEEYFGGERRSFDLPLDLAGSDFQRRVWLAMTAIRFGETASYARVAATVGAPNAYRAVGAACGANPAVIVVPCHRVIGSDGGLHGFGGGLEMKAWLLRHEGARVGRQAELALA